MTLWSISSQSQTLIDTSLLVAQHRVYFDSNSAVVEVEDVEKIDSIVNMADGFSNSFFYLTGHTDDVGNDEFNKNLSEKRVVAMRSILVNRGIQNDRIQTNAYGEDNPLADNESAEGRQLNRRATIAFYFSKKMLPVSGEIRDESTKEGMQGVVEVTAKDYHQKVETDTEGRFEVLIPSNEKVTIDLNANNYFFKTFELFKDSNDVINPIKVPLAKLETGKIFELKSMLFEGGLAVLRPDSEPVLPRLERMLRMNPEVCIEVAGHINLPNSPDTDSSSHTHGLSIARSLLVHDYLYKNGVAANRMLAKGYGNWQMKFPNTFKANEQMKNRRVEIIVKDCSRIAEVKNDTINNKLDYSLPNTVILKQLESIAEKDQKYRKQIRVTKATFGEDSPEVLKLWKLIERADKENLEDVESIIAEHGWLGGQRYGAGRRALFMVIQHADVETQEKYFPILKEASKRGRATREELAMITDRIKVSRDLPQIYGSQLVKDESGKYTLAPVENISKLNILRAKMGMESMEKYMLKFGLNWDVVKARMLMKERE